MNAEAKSVNVGAVMKVAVAGAVLIVVFGLGWLTAATGAGQEADPASLTDLEREFTERMRNVVLVGNFTIEGQERRDGLPERYEISQVTKLEGDRWRFDVHLTYGSVDATLPVVVPMVWAATLRWSASPTSLSPAWARSSAHGWSFTTAATPAHGITASMAD